MPIMTLDKITTLTKNALMGAGATEENAHSVAQSTMRAERDGIRSHGLMYVPIYAEHVVCGKVDGHAVSVVNQPKPSTIIVDAQSGFAHPAIDAGWGALTASARANGIAAMTIYNSYNCGVLGHHAERLAEEGLIGLCFTHAPASIAPVGGNVPIVGTNPFSIAVPGADGNVPIIIDQSASTIAKSEVLLRSKSGDPLEEGWAVDADGQPTTDPQAALKGSMTPSGGYKGFGVGLLVEILASSLAGAVPSREASPFSGTVGGPPKTGQCFIAIDPSSFADGFSARIAALVSAIDAQDNARVPGQRRKDNRERLAASGIDVDETILGRINAFIK